MTISEMLLPEYDHEMSVTRSLLEWIPEEHADWKPHIKSFSLEDLVMHIARTPEWLPAILNTTELNMEQGWSHIPFENKAAILKLFDHNVLLARTSLAQASDDVLRVLWTLKKGEVVYFTMPRIAVYRSMIMNHTIHHRGQLSVYLRLLDIPLPSIYGPTADTPV